MSEPRAHQEKRGGGAVSLWRVASAEAAGAALLVLLACLPPAAPPPARALAAGLTVALLVGCLQHVSGAHLNPAVTLAAALAARVSPRRALAMCAAQLLGALGGAAAARALQPAACACLTLPAPHLSAPLAAAVEALCGFCLALANLSEWERRGGAGESWPLRLGLAVAALSLAAGELTGASANPARSVGPAALVGAWRHHWVYWAGPLLGAALATALHRLAWRAPDPLLPVVYA